ncbi:MAG: XdhC family protein, partial [Pygmaiobacter sp.]
MNQTFYHSLAADLKAGDSVHLLTILSGTRGARDLTAQKALLHAGCVSAYDETLTDFWQQLSDHLPDGAAPRTVEMNGIRLLVEQICSRQKLVICGGGHIAFPLVALGTMLDFDVTVIDDRPEFANAERFPAARNVLCQPFEQALTTLEYTDSSYFVIVTRGHEN